MTTLTTIIGLLPLAMPAMFPAFFGPQEGRSAVYTPVALAVVGGLLTSTPLTLFLMPIVYIMLDDFKSWITKIIHTADRFRLINLHEKEIVR
jgi:HAE1 family hydrophobic/amphiphilic exporter-1